MSKVIYSATRFSGGISDYKKEEQPQGSHAFISGLDTRSDPRSLTLLPRAIKRSGSFITDLPKWATTKGDTYIYGGAGNIYSRTSAASYSFLRTVPNSHGNGMGYFGDDDYLWYTSDTTIGRYGPLSLANPQFVDDYFGSQGGVPQNTYSLDLESASSQYATAADSASLSITGDLAIEAYIKPETLPTVGNSMTLVSKWDESGTLRSYRFDINAISGFFGDGSGGALTISSNTTQTLIDSSASATVGTNTISATNASFSTGQVIYIFQETGTGVGTFQRTRIVSYTTGTITTEDLLNFSYSSSGANRAQVIVVPQYTTVTVNAGVTWSAKAWNGTVGGRLVFLANTSAIINGAISGSGLGFRGGLPGRSYGFNQLGQQGEGSAGSQTQSISPNGNGGGAGGPRSFNEQGHGGAGGGHANVGQNGEKMPATPSNDNFGRGGLVVGTTDLTTNVLGGGGGGGGVGDIAASDTGTGGNGGAGIFICSVDITIDPSTGSIVSNGLSGQAGGLDQGAGGAGAGGPILLKCQTASLGTNRVTSLGGSPAGGTSGLQGTGSVGRIHIDFLTSYTGTTNPTIDALQDGTLVTNTSQQLRLSVSSTGLNSEVLARTVNVQTAVWQHVAVSWDASTSTAEFFLNGVSLGTSTGTLTSIHNNASEFAVGTYENSDGSKTAFYDGLIDEVRLWSQLRTSNEILRDLSSEIFDGTSGLNAYYQFNNNANDETANNNDLTTSGSPVFSQDIPFLSPSTRLDIDQQQTAAGQTYTLPSAISEDADDRLTFTPTVDPQKSIAVEVGTVGTGSWTLTVHDSQNREVTSKTLTNTQVNVGITEFIFAEVWRPRQNEAYHFHLTSSDGTGTVVTNTLNDLETVEYFTYYQFLVEDSEFHPVHPFLIFLLFGNERYVAKYEAGLYEPNKLVLSPGLRVRCFSNWNEYVAIGCMSGESITSTDQGKIYFWDGVSEVPNFFIDIPDGGVNAMLQARGALYVLAGYQLQLLKYVGGTEAQPLKRVPRISQEEYAEVYPQALTMWRNYLRIGVAGNAGAEDLQKSVYTYGQATLRFPESLTADYPLSTGSLTGDNVKIGLTHVVDNTLLVGFQDNTSFGIDEITVGNDPQSMGTLEGLIIDNDAVWKEKSAQTVLATFSPLREGESVNVKYKIDREDNWTSLSEAVSEEGATEARIAVAGERYYELEVAADLMTTTTTSPRLLSLNVEVDGNEKERRV